MIDTDKLKYMLQDNYDDLYYLEDEIDEIIELIKMGEALKSLPHGAGITHGFSDITGDWIVHWNINPMLEPLTFHEDPLKALKSIKDE